MLSCRVIADYMLVCASADYATRRAAICESVGCRTAHDDRRRPIADCSMVPRVVTWLVASLNKANLSSSSSNSSSWLILKYLDASFDYVITACQCHAVSLSITMYSQSIKLRRDFRLSHSFYFHMFRHSGASLAGRKRRAPHWAIFPSKLNTMFGVCYNAIA